MNDFEKWWYEIGSGIRALPNHDFEEHGMRISKLAWVAANKQICNERDEARREAYRYWLILQCQLEADLGSITESKRLAKIYSENFGGEYFNDSSSENPPYYGFLKIKK